MTKNEFMGGLTPLKLETLKYYSCKRTFEIANFFVLFLRFIWERFPKTPKYQIRLDQPEVLESQINSSENANFGRNIFAALLDYLVFILAQSFKVLL